MKVRFIRVLTVALLFCYGISTHAQDAEVNTDIKAGVTKDVSERFAVAGNIENCFYDFFERQRLFSVGAEVAYRISPHVKADVGCQYFSETKPATDTETMHKDSYCKIMMRYYGSVTGEIRLGNLSVSQRERYQTSTTFGYNAVVCNLQEGSVTRAHVDGSTGLVLRSRTQMRYRIPDTRFSPVASFELINDFKDDFCVCSLRYLAGCEYSLNARSSVTISYERRDYKGSPNINMFCTAYRIRL